MKTFFYTTTVLGRLVPSTCGVEARRAKSAAESEDQLCRNSVIWKIIMESGLNIRLRLSKNL
jgi:hypothetical protein